MRSSLRWFTLLEMIAILAIVGIMIILSRSLFLNPNQDLLNSEVCIHTIGGQLNTFLYNAISGKKQTNTNDPHNPLLPDEYHITIKSEGNSTTNIINEQSIIFEIRENTSTSTTTPIISHRWNTTNNQHNSHYCANDRYSLVLRAGTSSELSEINAGTRGLKSTWKESSHRIVLNRNLKRTTHNRSGLQICKEDTNNPTCYHNKSQTLSPSEPYFFEYWLCTPAQWWGAQRIQDQNSPNRCMHIATYRLHQSTKTLDTTKCLANSQQTRTCQQRSIPLEQFYTSS